MRVIGLVAALLVFLALAAGLVVLALTAGAPAARSASRAGETQRLVAAAVTATYFAPLPPAPAELSERASLGKRLFVDEALSQPEAPGGGRPMSCASCHELTAARAGASPSHGGTDKNIAGTYEARNTPSVFNAALNFRQRWRGEKDTLQEMITVPLVELMHAPRSGARPPAPGSPEERQRIAEVWRSVIQQLAHTYGAEMARLYPQHATDDDAIGGVSRAGIEDALTEYMKALLPSEGCHFDEVLRKHEALEGDAREGHRLFIDYGCVSCHQGRGVGGNMMAEFGVMLDGRQPLDDDIESLITRDDHGVVVRRMYKVPSLRNVARTAPYFHTGSVATLERAIAIMGRAQLGRRLTADEIREIKAFLVTLNGEPGKAALP